MSDTYSTPADAAGMDALLVDGQDGFTDAERAQFGEMANATIDAPPGPDEGAGGDPGAAGADGAAADAGAGAADASKRAAAPPGAAAGEAAAAAAADAGADDDDDEPEAGAAAPGADGERKPKRVSFSKYSRAEERANAAEAKLRAAEERNARFDERMRILNEALTKPKPQEQEAAAEEPAMPDPEQDIFGAFRWATDKIAKMGDEIRSMREGKQSEDTDRDMHSRYVGDVERFKSTEDGKHFQDAYNHLMASRLQELALYYFDKDLSDPATTLSEPEITRIRQAVQAEERGIAEQAFAQGRSPAKVVYALARSRGFRPQAPAAAAAGGAGGGAAPAGGAAGAGGAPNGAGKGAAPAGGQGGQRPNVTEEIKKLQSGVEASTSLSGGGGAPKTPMTATRLADMPQAEFEAWLDQTDPEEFRLIVEGRP